MPSLKTSSLASWLILFLAQLGLLWPAYEIDHYWILLLAIPLLFPLRGLLTDQRYTYRWIGFMTLFYFCIGISELVSNPQLRTYGFATTLASTSLFLSSIYYARYLGSAKAG